MSYTPNDGQSQTRNPEFVDETARPRVIHPSRAASSFFPGWGPKLLAITLAASAMGIATGNARAESISQKPACASTDLAAHAVSIETPDYPETASLRSLEGTSVVLVRITANGNLENASIAKSAGDAALDREAIRSARNSRYSAETVHCQPVGGDYLYQVDFNQASTLPA